MAQGPPSDGGLYGPHLKDILGVVSSTLKPLYQQVGHQGPLRLSCATDHVYFISRLLSEESLNQRLLLFKRPNNGVPSVIDSLFIATYCSICAINLAANAR